jgi:hypothetical protein
VRTLQEGEIINLTVPRKRGSKALGEDALESQSRQREYCYITSQSRLLPSYALLKIPAHVVESELGSYRSRHRYLVGNSALSS